MLNPDGRFENADRTIELPDVATFQGQRPLAFLVPSSVMTDADGNGPGWPTRDSLRDLSRDLVGRGFATYRFRDPSALLTHFGEAAREPRSAQGPCLVLGIGDGADAIAKRWYDLIAIRSIEAAVLLSPTVSALHLNQLNCPYLAIHGSTDPQFRDHPYHRFEAAVHHHQMRFGDQTEHHLVHGLGEGLGDPYLDPRVVRQIGEWLVLRTFESAQRPQEPAAGNAVPRDRDDAAA
jgi:hypothetical protein